MIRSIAVLVDHSIGTDIFYACTVGAPDTVPNFITGV